MEAVEEVVAGHTAGSPVDPGIRWTNRSPAEISEELAAGGFRACPDTVRRILREDLGLGVRQARKEDAAKEYAFRDEQFTQIARLREWYQQRGWPVVSIDTKKKEPLGNFFRPGRAYTDGVVRVLDHDFASLGAGRLVPYGVYDVAADEGFLMLSLGADTSQLACDSLWRWWQRLGRRHYWHASGLLVLCDCGGGNGYRRHRFKEDLKELAIRLRRPIRVAHYPPGCSKYNPIEHRLFCHASRTLRGVVLKSVDVAKRFLERTATRTGLKVVVEKARKTYLKGRQASARFLESFPVEFDELLPDLNYLLDQGYY